MKPFTNILLPQNVFFFFLILKHIERVTVKKTSSPQEAGGNELQVADFFP